MVVGNFLIFPTLKRKLADLTLSLESFFYAERVHRDKEKRQLHKDIPKVTKALEKFACICDI
jgi:hypothetical protein